MLHDLPLDAYIRVYSYRTSTHIYIHTHTFIPACTHTLHIYTQEIYIYIEREK